MAEKNIITPEPEPIETFPETTGGGKDMTPKEETGITDSYLSHLDYVAVNIDRFVSAKQKIWLAVLHLAKEGDWVVFKTGEKETVCLTGAGSDRIASSLGISFTNWSEKKEEWEDDKGRAYRYWMECDCSFGGRKVRAIGRCGSRDKFFGKKDGQFRPLSDIEESNIRMAAFHNAMKEGVKLILGLRSIPKNEFEKAGIKLAYAGGYEFKSRTPSENGGKPAVCQGCDVVVSKEVEEYSKKKHGKILCRDCQKKGEQK